MNTFRLFVLGDSFDVDACLNTISLTPTRVWRRSPSRHDTLNHDDYPTSGFDIALGDGDALNIDDQQRIAREFIEAHTEQLKAVAEFPGATTRTIAINVPVNEESGLGFCVSPLPTLMWHALMVRFDINFYLSIEPDTHRRLTLPFKPIEDKKNCQPVLVTTSVIIHSPDDIESAQGIQDVVTQRLRHSVAQTFADMPAVEPVGSVSFVPLNPAEDNCGRCSKCGCWMSDSQKPDCFQGLPWGTIIDGKLLCDQCETFQVIERETQHD